MTETVIDTWFGNIWKSSRKSLSREPERPVLGILAFEISRLMSKVVRLWQDLGDGKTVRLREDIANSVGIRKLVSEDDDFLMDLVLAEIIGNLGSVAKSVVMLGKKCSDPIYHNLERVLNDVGDTDPKWHSWQYRLKKMEKKVKKMERFVATTEQLYQEIDVLAELEQSLGRMRAGSDSSQVKLLEFQQKVVWQRQEVKNFREMSPWVRTYDYIVRLLLRSIFTIIERIKYVYGTKQSGNLGGNHAYEHMNSDCLIRSNSIAAIMQTSPVYPSEANLSRFAVPLGRSSSTLGFGRDKSKSKNVKFHFRTKSFIFSGKSRTFSPAGFTGCITVESQSPVVESCTPSCSGSFRTNDASLTNPNRMKDTRAARTLHSSLSSTEVSFFNSNLRLLDAPPATLGNAALALLYANIIILIEKLASAPHLISHDARHDLYNMLPGTIRSCLRVKLKTFSRNLASSPYDAAFAAEWSLALTRILEWLSPLAHNMVRWQAERNFQKQRLIFGSNVHLVQTLYFANQVETEAVIVELLMGLNYLSRFGGEISQEPFRISSSCSRSYDGYVFPRDAMYCKMIDHMS